MSTAGSPAATTYGRHLLTPGSPTPLGATPLASGTNFAVRAPYATTVELVLAGEDPTTLETRTDGTWHGHLDGVGPGREYAFVVDGRRILDPYARWVTGGLDDHEPALRSYVAHNGFEWDGDVAPRVPWDRTVLYEAHVRGLTMLSPEVPEHQRGTYAGLAHERVLDSLVELGVTTVELLPVHHFVTEPSVAERGKVNYWGYNTAAFFAPHAPYAAGDDPVTEFKQMVRTMHARGLEVVLDVVYNHTCEGGEDGPTVHLRHLDEDAYYRAVDGHYVDVTGCGNTVRTDHRDAADLILESLRYWVREMHVDGFRFDLTSALARVGDGEVDLKRSIVARIADDPVLSTVKLIAEPWDVTGEGYLVGQFGEPWSEWNDGFRDDVRDFWRGLGGGVAGIATRLAGSSQGFGGRRTTASVNFVTAHDGFTVRDVVSYDHKHNEANGEDNHDGHDDNRSWNCGIEGETDDADVLDLRHRQAANLVSTVLLSAGVPMLTAGTEVGHTQGGNNNAYCQDNEVAWLPGRAGEGWEHLRPLIAVLTRLRAEHPVLRPGGFYTGTTAESGRQDLRWLHPDGRDWRDEDWSDQGLRTLGMAIDGDPVGDACAVVLMNAGDEPVDWTLPGEPWPTSYEVAVDTGGGSPLDTVEDSVTVRGHTLVLLLAR